MEINVGTLRVSSCVLCVTRVCVLLGKFSYGTHEDRRAVGSHGIGVVVVSLQQPARGDVAEQPVGQRPTKHRPQPTPEGKGPDLEK